jgi:hypothetical protein
MAMPDLTDEATTPDQLPEDEWFALAASMRARGELRLALRAMFLGMLARLAREGWIVPHPGKSNRDYQRELARRGPAEEPLLRAVQDNVLLFEGAWYGEHAAEDALFSRFEHNLNTVIGHAR